MADEPVIRRGILGRYLSGAAPTVTRRGIRGGSTTPPAPTIPPAPIQRNTSGNPITRIMQVPFQFERSGSVMATTDPDTQVRQSVEALLNTNPGERVMKPSYGVSLVDYLFDNISPAEIAEMQQRISNGFDTWIPSARLVALTGVVGPIDLSTATISLQYARRYDANAVATALDVPVVTE